LKSLAILLVALGTLPLGAQDASTAAQTAPPVETTPNSSGNPLSLVGEFLGTNYANVFGFVNGMYDSSQSLVSGGKNSSGGFGLDLGGGVQVSHPFRRSYISLNYRGDYRNYNSQSIGSGTSQYLALDYSMRLSKRWSLSLAESAGISLYGTAFYGSLANPGYSYSTNPFSPSTRFLSSSIFASYQATHRWSYTLGGSFFLNRYNYPGAFGSTGGFETASASYQFTNRTSGSITYSHDDFYFQHAAGESHINGIYASGNHSFPNRWNIFGSFGMTQAQNQGTIRLPIEFIFNGVPVTGYAIGHYKTSNWIPTLSGGASKAYRNYTISASAGRGVTPGNGTILTSSNTYFGGFASRSFRNSNLGGGAFYSHISSISNTVSSAYTQSAFTVSYSRLVLRHVSASGAYGYYRYGTLQQIGAISDNRFSFGISVSSRNVPLTLF
jgi:hypothetical protein